MRKTETIRAELAKPVSPAAAECDAARQASVYSTAVSLFRNLSSLDSGPCRPNETSAIQAALEYVWSSAFVHGFQKGKQCAQPAPTTTWRDAPTEPGLWLCDCLGEELSVTLLNRYEVENFDRDEMKDCHVYEPAPYRGIGYYVAAEQRYPGLQRLGPRHDGDYKLPT